MRWNLVAPVLGVVFAVVGVVVALTEPVIPWLAIMWMLISGCWAVTAGRLWLIYEREREATTGRGRGRRSP